ncbi:DMT family transporter [Clostridium sp. ZS2-4]|uniref:DMT family transporter n=1 Tax=Clostridium sp. ZS2-4 TaxID=2987703 RepID=UPI00227A2B94|nr:DMT family transporter [Clostridium sp. ZS2-4]MCY6356085.1 DMT family transporter [Clostridium sp. ZS2-4]
MKKIKITYVDLVLLFVALLWGVNPVVVKVGMKYIPPLPFNTMRMLIASIFCWVILYMSRTYKKMDKNDIKKIFCLGFFGYFMYQVGFIIGINNTTAGNTSLIVGMLPISVALINRIFKIEQITLKMFLGIIVSFIGVVLIIIGSGSEFRISYTDIKGGIFLIIGQLALGYYTVFSKPMLRKYSNIQVTACFISIAALLFLIINFKSIINVSWNTVPTVGWMSNIFSGGISMCIGNVLWIWGVNQVGSVRTSLYNNMAPVFTIIVGYIFIGESFGVIKGIGVLTIFIGMYLTKNNRKAYKIKFKESNIYGMK